MASKWMAARRRRNQAFGLVAVSSALFTAGKNAIPLLGLAKSWLDWREKSPLRVVISELLAQPFTTGKKGKVALPRLERPEEDVLRREVEKESVDLQVPSRGVIRVLEGPCSSGKSTSLFHILSGRIGVLVIPLRKKRTDETWEVFICRLFRQLHGPLRDEGGRFSLSGLLANPNTITAADVQSALETAIDKSLEKGVRPVIVIDDFEVTVDNKADSHQFWPEYQTLLRFLLDISSKTVVFCLCNNCNATHAFHRLSEFRDRIRKFYFAFPEPSLVMDHFAHTESFLTNEQAVIVSDACGGNLGQIAQALLEIGPLPPELEDASVDPVEYRHAMKIRTDNLRTALDVIVKRSVDLLRTCIIRPPCGKTGLSKRVWRVCCGDLFKMLSDTCPKFVDGAQYNSDSDNEDPPEEMFVNGRAREQSLLDDVLDQATLLNIDTEYQSSPARQKRVSRILTPVGSCHKLDELEKVDSDGAVHVATLQSHVLKAKRASVDEVRQVVDDLMSEGIVRYSLGNPDTLAWYTRSHRNAWAVVKDDPEVRNCLRDAYFSQ